MGLKNLNQITTVNKVAIPPEIMEHFKSEFLDFDLLYFIDFYLRFFFQI